MTKSMTSYSHSSIVTELGELSCELRSVNHRYLEIAPKMPEELRVFERDIRELINSKLARGRVDCFLRFRDNSIAKLTPNDAVADELSQLVELIQLKVPNMQAIRAIDVLRWPGVLQSKEMDADAMRDSLHELLGDVLDGLVAMRVQEGDKMAELLNQRLVNMRKIVADVTQILPEIAQAHRQRLDDKLVDIKDQLDPSRLEQELVIFLQKIDVSEELDRLTVHIGEVQSILTKSEPCGRRLDFLMQELNREANTLGSKAQDQRMTAASVDLKVLIEQMREQVQNIE